ncbi:MAG: hypothetical protein ACLTZY_02990 [Alistipes indistinctus]
MDRHRRRPRPERRTPRRSIGSAKNYENFESDRRMEDRRQRPGLGRPLDPADRPRRPERRCADGQHAPRKHLAPAAANRPGSGIRCEVRVVSDRVTVVLNGVTTAQNVILEKHLQP